MENEDIRINRICSALLLNQLPPKEKDPGSFILPCSIGRLDFNNALADLGASISITSRMPIILGRPMLTTAHAKIDVFKRSISLEVGNEKVIFKLRNDLHDMKSESILMIQSNIIAEEDELMNIESDLFTYNTNTCESCHTLAIDTDLFTYEIKKTRTILGKKKSHWCARQNNGIREVWASCNPSNEECDEGSLRNNAIRCYWESENDNDHGTSDDEEDIEGIIDYLEPTSYDGFIDLDEEEYNKKRCRLLGMPYIAPLPLIIKQVEITQYSLGPGDVYTKVEVLNMEELPRTRNNIATIRIDIMDEVYES
ncbi:hypothetical protein Tco_0666953 [Tanacetum coccineum]